MNTGIRDTLTTAVHDLGKPEWRPMLRYVADLHARSIHPPAPPFALPWEEIGPGYCYGPAFGHWDIVHAVLDTLPAAPEHGHAQIVNLLSTQHADGYLPAIVWMRDTPRPESNQTHPPLWPVVVEMYVDITGNDSFIRACWEPLVRQIGWFERNRTAQENGFYYTDILNHRWESGVDEGVRFDDVPTGALACVDATAHLYSLYDSAARWAPLLGEDAVPWRRAADTLRAFIQQALWDEETGFFHDVWAVGRPQLRRLAFEGMWPVVVGAATPEQAARVIDENLLNERRFFTPHPMSTVGREDPRFELRMWRGPAWNSMTYWAARGCLRYGRTDAAARLLERALDASAAQFARTGTIWEFNHPFGGAPQELVRKHGREQQGPCPDYLGHNPLIAMARLWQATRAG
jgi:putative isomerase